MTLSHAGYVKARSSRRVPGAAARRAGADGHPDEAGGLRRPAVHRPHPRHAAVLLGSRPRLLAQGLRGAAGRGGGPRHPDRESPAPRGRRAHQRGAPGARLRPGRLRVHGDAGGDRQEDRARRVLAPAFERDHRGASRRRRLPRRCGAHRRGARHHAVLERGQGDPLRGARGAGDGPHVAGGARHPARRCGECVVALIVSGPGQVLSVTENGFGKRTPVGEFRVQQRGGLGLIAIKTSARNGVRGGCAAGRRTTTRWC